MIKKIFIILLVIILMTAFLILRVEENRNIIISRLRGSQGEIKGELSLIRVIPDIVPHSEAFLIGSNLVLWQEEKVFFISPENKVLNEREVLFKEPKIYKGVGRCIIFGKGEKEVFLFNEKGDRTAIIKTNNPTIAVKDLGDTIGVIERGLNGETLEIFNPKGDIQLSLRGNNSHFGDLLSLPDKFIYNTFYLKDGVINSVIISSDREGNEIDRRNFEGLILKILDEGRIILTKDDLVFLDEDKTLFNDLLKSKEERGEGNIIGVAQGNNIGLLTEDRLIEVSHEGEVISNISHTKGYNEVSKFKDGFIIAGSGGFMLVQKGKVFLNEKMSLSDIITDGNIIITFSEEGSKWYEVKYVVE